MLKNLQKKWKASGYKFLLILISFAGGGSLCGYTARKLTGLLNTGHGPAWVICYVIIAMLLWPVCILLVSMPLGQFSFFRKYLLKSAGRLAGSHKKIKMAIFASGAGSNAEKIIDYFKNHSTICVALIVCNKPGAGVLQIASSNNIPVLQIGRDLFFHGDAYADELKKRNISWLILAGFLWKVPAALIKAYPDRIINIHPALLPKYGGKGMYGQHVHEAVILNKEKESGITIHLADELYDHGKVILQVKCAVLADDDAASVASKIHSLEHIYYPKAIEDTIIKDAKSPLNQKRLKGT